MSPDPTNPPLPAFVSFGEALTDLLRTGPDAWRSANGGAPWNVALALAALGPRSAFGGAVSRDVFGAALLDASRAAGLDLRFLQQVERAPLLAVVHETAPPRYFFVGADSADLYFDPQALPAGWMDALQWAHFGGISLAREPLAARLVALAAALKAAGKTISYDPNFRAGMDARYDATLERMCRLADVIKVSDEDLRGLFRDADWRTGLARLRAWNPRALLLLSRGAQGATLFHPRGAVTAAAPAIRLVDSVGAGDACMAALICSLLQSPQAAPAEHLRQAVAAGSAACTRAGAGLPLAALHELLDRVQVRGLDGAV